MSRPKTITVPTKTDLRTTAVLASRGVWAAHITLYPEGTTGLGDLTITHVPTGLAFLRDLPSVDAARAVMLLLPAEWASDASSIVPGGKISKKAARSPGWRQCRDIQAAVRELHDGWEEAWL